MYSSPCCSTVAGAATYTVPYASTALTLGASGTGAVPLAVAPYQFTVSKASAAMLTFTGSVTASASGVITLVLSYYNTAVPSVVQTQTVPITASVSSGVYTPIASSLAVPLPAGTYAVSVLFASAGAGLTLTASGTLNIAVSS
jgi:hypothetical protein